jgi:hypothetical protein
MSRRTTRHPTAPAPRQPPEATTSDGELRRVGVEVELGGLELETILHRLQRVAGGKIIQHSAYAATLRDSRVGEIEVELDARLFTELKVRGLLDKIGLDHLEPKLGQTVEELMAGEARRFVPYEIVFAPIEIARLPELDAICGAFRDDAEGTGASLFNAFGLHLNPELPRQDAATLLRYLRAFFCLGEELEEAHAVDTTRALSPFIDAFPKDYAARVLAPGYAPEAAALIDDYLEANPTRNRPLDLLPALAWLDEERVKRQLPKEKISRRPALHYRLPNSRIDEAGWSIVREWNIWGRVEELAFDEEALTAAMREKVAGPRNPLEKMLNWFKAE